MSRPCPTTDLFGVLSGVTCADPCGRPVVCGTRRVADRPRSGDGCANGSRTRRAGGSVIAFKFQVDCSMAAVWRLLHRHGWSWQSPARRAVERDEPGPAPHPATPGPHRRLPCRHRTHPYPSPDNTPKRLVGK
ncbi:winged helix-turn-helix domain-containing protein [Streptomyces sp. NPDC048825]|uniref:helix-turn-helix domain-containing protein n=1 Tax=Streptomyces sp. NPDC048825 TaxID=3365592 RepID=UPI00371D3720